MSNVSVVPRVTPRRLSISFAWQKFFEVGPWERKQIWAFRYELLRFI